MKAISAACKSLLLVYLLLAVTGSVYADGTTVADMVEQVKKCVVLVTTKDAKGVVKTGTGFFISPSGYLLTCQHVVSGPEFRKDWTAFKIVTIQAPKSKREEAMVVESIGEYDVALLKVTGHSHYFLNLSLKKPRQGDEVYVLGYPLGGALGGDPTLTRGIVSAVRSGGDIIQIDAAVNPGNSGGPVLDSTGQVVGIAWATLKNAQGLNFAVTAEASRELSFKTTPDWDVAYSSYLRKEELGPTARDWTGWGTEARVAFMEGAASTARLIGMCAAFKGFDDSSSTDIEAEFDTTGLNLEEIRTYMDNYISTKNLDEPLIGVYLKAIDTAKFMNYAVLVLPPQ